MKTIKNKKFIEKQKNLLISIKKAENMYINIYDTVNRFNYKNGGNIPRITQIILQIKSEDFGDLTQNENLFIHSMISQCFVILIGHNTIEETTRIIKKNKNMYKEDSEFYLYTRRLINYNTISNFMDILEKDFQLSENPYFLDFINTYNIKPQKTNINLQVPLKNFTEIIELKDINNKELKDKNPMLNINIIYE
jgi:hypothetical protein